MIDMPSIAAIRDALQESLGLDCFYRACLTTYGMAPPRENGTALFEGQRYHVPADATHDYLYFRHPELNVLITVVLSDCNYLKGQYPNMAVSVGGFARQWVTPGEPRVKYDAEGSVVWEHDSFDSDFALEQAPFMPHGFKSYGGMHDADGLAHHKYEGPILPPEKLVSLLEHIFAEHYDLKPLSDGPHEEYQISFYLPHYCWEPTQSGFYKRFPQDKIRDLAKRFYGGEPLA